MIQKTSDIIAIIGFRLNQVGKHSEAIEFADAALNLARKEGNACEQVHLIAFWKVKSLKALGRTNEARGYLDTLLGEFPDDADLHGLFSRTVAEGSTLGKPYSDLCLTHALRAVELRPEDPMCLGWASWVCSMNGRLKEAMGFAKKEFAHARDDEDRLSAINHEAQVYEQGGLYDDAIRAYRKALDIDPENADAMAYIAHCLYMLDRIKAAGDMAKRSLLYDPDNQLAKDTLSDCQRDERFGNSF